MAERSRTQNVEEMLNMLEQCSVEDREKLINNISSADPAFAALLNIKLITVEKVYSLDEESLSRILEDIPDKIFGHTLRGLDLELRQRALSLVNKDRRQMVLKLLRQPAPLQSEMESYQRQMVQKSRALEKCGKVHMGALRRSTRRVA